MRKVNEDKQILNAIWQRKPHSTDHILRHGGLLHKIIEGRMKVKPSRERRLQMLHELTKVTATMPQSSEQLRIGRN